LTLKKIFFFCWTCSYLHKNEIVHGNLSLATIFIQHNGLIKIGSGEMTHAGLWDMSEDGVWLKRCGCDMTIVGVA